jgi:hypothetical protein
VCAFLRNRKCSTQTLWRKEDTLLNFWLMLVTTCRLTLDYSSTATSNKLRRQRIFRTERRSAVDCTSASYSEGRSSNPETKLGYPD